VEQVLILMFVFTQDLYLSNLRFQGFEEFRVVLGNLYRRKARKVLWRPVVGTFTGLNLPLILFLLVSEHLVFSVNINSIIIVAQEAQFVQISYVLVSIHLTQIQSLWRQLEGFLFFLDDGFVHVLFPHVEVGNLLI
jgi:hypothetical protein